MKKTWLFILSLILLLGNTFTAHAVYDLAIKKTVLNSGPYEIWDSVQFFVEVFNQWDEKAENIRVTDYISSGLNLNDLSWTQTGSTNTWFFAEYEFTDIPAGESRRQSIFYTITDDSDSLINSHVEISRDNGSDCDSTPDRNALNDGIILDDYIGTWCEIDSEIWEDDHDAEIITIRDSNNSSFRPNIRVGTNSSLTISFWSNASLNTNLGSGISSNTSFGSDASLNTNLGSSNSLNTNFWSDSSLNTNLGSSSSLNTSFGSGTSLDTNFGNVSENYNFIIVDGSYYIPVSNNNFYGNGVSFDDSTFITIDQRNINIPLSDYEFRSHDLEELETGTGSISTDFDINDKNRKLVGFWTDTDGFIQIAADINGNDAFNNTLIEVAKSLKNLFYAISGIFFLIISIRLIFASNTDEELGKFKKWVIWITIGIIVMQLALSFVTLWFWQGVSAEVGENLIAIIVQPMLLLLQTLASLFFIAVAIFAFYRLVTANGEEDKIKSGKNTILYAVIWFMIVKFASVIVNAFYGQVNCEDQNSWSGVVSTTTKICRNDADFSQGINLIMSIITWLNSFVALAVLLMLIYAGIQILLSGWDEERVSKGKKSIIYIIIWLAILAINYLILVFFLSPELTSIS